MRGTVIACDDTEDPANHPDGFNALYADSHVDFVSGQGVDTAGNGGMFSSDAGGERTGGKKPLDLVCN